LSALGAQRGKVGDMWQEEIKNMGHNNLSKCCQLLLSTFLKITQPPILKHPVIFGIAKTKK